MIHKFRIHFASRNIFKTREGIEIECRFYINADNYDTALQSARVWEQNFIKKKSVNQINVFNHATIFGGGKI